MRALLWALLVLLTSPSAIVDGKLDGSRHGTVLVVVRDHGVSAVAAESRTVGLASHQDSGDYCKIAILDANTIVTNGGILDITRRADGLRWDAMEEVRRIFKSDPTIKTSELATRWATAVQEKIEPFWISGGYPADSPEGGPRDPFSGYVLRREGNRDLVLEVRAVQLTTGILGERSSRIRVQSNPECVGSCSAGITAIVDEISRRSTLRGRKLSEVLDKEVSQQQTQRRAAYRARRLVELTIEHYDGPDRDAIGFPVVVAELTMRGGARWVGKHQGCVDDRVATSPR